MNFRNKIYKKLENMALTDFHDIVDGLKEVDCILQGRPVFRYYHL